MKILVITTKSPYPLNEGRALRTYNLIREMTRQHELHLVSFVQDAIDVEGIEHMRSICPVVEAIPLYLGKRGKLKLLPDVLREPFGRAPLPVVKYVHAGMRRTIARLRREHRYDLVHLDMLHLAGYLPDLRDVPVLLMEHNLEAQILKRRADLEQQPLKKAYLAYQERKLRAFEQQACREATTVVAVSDVDARQIDELSGRTDTLCVPNGVDTGYFRSARPAQGAPAQGHTLVYVGGFTWFPNLDAIDYFRREILPAVRAQVPDVKLKVIGRYVPNAQAREIQADPAIELCGMVDDIRPTIDAAAIYIVPLRIGGGTRLKILDALSMGKAIVSTSVGCEGLEVTDGLNIVVADGAQAFADTLIRLFQAPAQLQTLGANGRALAESTYDWSAIGRGLASAYERTARARPAGARQG